jgi:hypothetical protein
MLQQYQSLGHSATGKTGLVPGCVGPVGDPTGTCDAAKTIAVTRRVFSV